MARLGREVEQKIPTREQVPHDMTTADVGNIDLHPITDIDDVGWIAAIFGDHTVDYHNFCAKLHEAPCQCGADKAYTAGDHHPRTSKRFEARIETRTHHFSRSKVAEGCLVIRAMGPGPLRQPLLFSGSNGPPSDPMQRRRSCADNAIGSRTIPE